MAADDPYLDAGMRGWIVRTAKANFWRVSEWYDLSDLIQDGYLCYYKCRSRYREFAVLNHPGRDQKRQFMALVQAAFTNHLNTLANKRTLSQETTVSQVAGEDESHADFFERSPVYDLGDATLRAMIAKAPKEIADFLTLFGTDVEAAKTCLRAKLLKMPNGRVRRNRRALRETTNMKYCRQLGLDGVDVRGRVKAYFNGGGDSVDRLVELLPICMVGE